MNCVYSEPLVLDTDGTLISPVDDTQPFQFSQLECVSVSESSTISGSLSDEQFNFFVTSAGYMEFFTILVIILLGSFYVQTFFKR